MQRVVEGKYFFIYNGSVYTFHAKAVFLSESSIDVLSLAAKRSDAIYLLDPIELFRLADIDYPHDKDSLAIIQREFRTMIKKPTFSPDVNDAITKSLTSLNEWLKTSDSCIVQHAAATYIRNIARLKRSPDIPLSCVPLLSCWRVDAEQIMCDVYRDFFKEFPIISHDIREAAFALVTRGYLSKINEKIHRQDDLITLSESPTDLTEWKLYGRTLRVFKAIVLFAETPEIKGCVFYIGSPTVDIRKRGRERIMTPKEFFEFFAKKAGIELDEEMTRPVRLWQHFLCRYVTDNVSALRPTHVEIINV